MLQRMRERIIFWYTHTKYQKGKKAADGPTVRMHMKQYWLLRLNNLKAMLKPQRFFFNFIVETKRILGRHTEIEREKLNSELVRFSHGCVGKDWNKKRKEIQPHILFTFWLVRSLIPIHTGAQCNALLWFGWKILTTRLQCDFAVGRWRFSTSNYSLKTFYSGTER